jgi:hypothetical protein
LTAVQALKHTPALEISGNKIPGISQKFAYCISRIYNYYKLFHPDNRILSSITGLRVPGPRRGCFEKLNKIYNGLLIPDFFAVFRGNIIRPERP